MNDDLPELLPRDRRWWLSPSFIAATALLGACATGLAYGVWGMP